MKPKPEPVVEEINPFFVDRCTQMEDEMEELAERIELIHRVSDGVDQLKIKADTLQTQSERMAGILSSLQTRVFNIERLAVDQELEAYHLRQKVNPEIWRKKHRRNY